MTQRPSSNGLPNQEPFNRYVAELAEQANLAAGRAAGEIDDQANLFQSMFPTIDLLREQVSQLYAATGNTWPPTPPEPTPDPAPPAVQDVMQVEAAWSATWGSSSQYSPGGGEDTNGNYLYQGSNPENKIGIWGFDLSKVAGKTILAADMVLRNLGSPYSASFIAGFGTHTYTGVPGGKPSRQNAFDVGWSRGEHKWFPLPTWTYGPMSSGGITGFSIGGIGPSDPNYAYFSGVGAPNPPAIRITYLK